MPLPRLTVQSTPRRDRQPTTATFGRSLSLWGFDGSDCVNLAAVGPQHDAGPGGPNCPLTLPARWWMYVNCLCRQSAPAVLDDVWAVDYLRDEAACVSVDTPSETIAVRPFVFPASGRPDQTSDEQSDGCDAKR